MNIEEIKKSKEAAQKLQQAFAAQKKKYEESKGYGNECDSKEDELYSLMCYFDRCISQVYQSIWAVSDALWEHRQNHLPKLTPTAMEKLLGVAGMEKDVEIVKPAIYMSAASVDKRGEMTIDFTKNGK